MKPATYKTLLRDLQKLQKKLVAAYEAEVRDSDERMAWVTARWKDAEVGGRVDDYLDVVARRSAVQFILRTVYTRLLEDLGALTPPRIRGQWGLAAFKEVAPSLGLRGYLRWVFRDLAKDFPALFTPGPDELPLPNEDLVREVWELWHQEDGKGGLVYGWQAADAETGGTQFDSRFLGDLYQDLDKEVRMRFALLQTPVFVEEYILDHTLTPALVEFDPAALRDQGETFRLIDPTCGSGHFLIGAFHRLADWWQTEHGCDAWTAATRALESVWGADLNPHAVDIARFRLLLEVRERTGETSLDKLASLPLNLAVMDSLIPWERLQKQPELFPERDRLAKYATAEERAANAAFLGRDFHVVVGNPPYITPKDKGKRDDYRSFWATSCYMKYSLSAPFAERFIRLPVRGGFSGQITANSFMKRQFGIPLVERVFPTVNLWKVVDTSGAYIPGHGTPTVVLFAINHPPPTGPIHAVLGKRGEPVKPTDPAHGLVWSSIAEAGDIPDDSDRFVTVAAIPRQILAKHPWSLEGGKSRQVFDTLSGAQSSRLEDIVTRTGMQNVTGLNDVYYGVPRSMRANNEHAIRLVEGTSVRDYAVQALKRALFPYDSERIKESRALEFGTAEHQLYWRYRETLQQRTTVGLKSIRERGSQFNEYSFYAPQALMGRYIAFAFVSTNNHFVLSPGGMLFNRTSPGLVLANTATEPDHFDLLGLLNSSTLGFWMKQVFHCKGASSGEAIRSEDWEPFWEYDATKLKKAPLTKADGDRRVALARALDATAQDRAACLPAAVLATDWTADTLRPTLDAAMIRYAELTHHMVALQEELDWLTYGSYGLLDDVETVAPDAIEPLSPGHRPFEIRAARADEDAPPEEKSAWWSRHGHPKVTEIPTDYSPAHRARIQARMDLIEEDYKLQLLETFPFKRRWQLPDLDKEVVKAAESWLLDRLEDQFAEGGALSEPLPYRLEEIVAAWTTNPRVAAAAAVFEGTTDVDLTLVAEKLLDADSLPDNPWRLYSESGLRKLDQWKEVWALQDREDAGEDVGTIEKPPELKREDFVRSEFYSIRGKLNVPRERFIAFEDLHPTRYGWNGWRDLERAMAQVHAYTEAEGDPHNPLPPPTHDDPRRCGVTLGLWESLDDVKRWSDADHHAELSSLAQEGCRQEACPCAVVERWQQWANGEIEVTTEIADDTAEVTLEDRARLTELLNDFGTKGARTAELVMALGWSSAQVQRVLDDLVASGNVATSGRGSRTMYAKADFQQTMF